MATPLQPPPPPPPPSVNPVHNAPVDPSSPMLAAPARSFPACAPPLAQSFPAGFPPPPSVLHRALPSLTPKTLHRERAVIGRIFHALPNFCPHRQTPRLLLYIRFTEGVE
jgi:hypothetical protein